MAFKTVSDFNLQDFTNAINAFGSSDYKIYIDFSNHMSNTDDASINNIGSVVEAFTTGSDSIQIPVNPEKLPVSLEADTETVNILGLGEVNLLKGTHLKTIELESFLPSTFNTLTVSNALTKIQNFFSFPETPNLDVTNFIQGLYKMGDMPPYISSGAMTMSHLEFKEKFISAVENNTVVKLVVTGSNINMLCTIESFDWENRYGTDDIYYKISLKEYKRFKYNKVGEKSSEYCTDDTVKYKSSSDAQESEGKVIKTKINSNGSKSYCVRGQVENSSLTNLDDVVKDMKKYNSMDKWITKDLISGRMV